MKNFRATEIELKAHVNDIEALRTLLLQKAEYLGAFEKEDTYWVPKEPDMQESTQDETGSVKTRRSSGLRVRKEKRTLPDGTEKSVILVTKKAKEMQDNIEVNKEDEFEISTSEEQDFKKQLIKEGLKPASGKRKQGWAFNHNKITAELVEVEGLGWFIELEILFKSGIEFMSYMGAERHDGGPISIDNIDKARTKIIAETEKKLKDFLSSLGIAEDAIEPRYYSKMLAERAGRQET